MIRKCPTFTLKACRINKNLKIGDVADKLGVTERTVINWEKYNTTPKSIHLRALSELYGIDENLIFLGDKFALSKHYRCDSVGGSTVRDG